METRTQKEALQGLRAFQDDRPKAYVWMNVTDVDGLVGQYVGLGRMDVAGEPQYTSVAGAYFRIEDSHIVQLDRYRKAQPGFDTYYAFVTVHGDVFGVRHEAVDWTVGKSRSVHGEILYYTVNGDLVLEKVG